MSKYTVLIALLALLGMSAMYAASFVTHIYCAEKFLKTCHSYTAADKESFRRGCIWPDGRYAWNIARDKTHVAGVTLHAVRACANPCDAGKKFHCFVDEAREHFVARCGILNKLPAALAERYRVSFLKVLEDEILYRQANAACCMRKSLARIGQAEIIDGVSNDMVGQWHDFVNVYLHKRPSASFAQACKEKRIFMGLSPKIAGEWGTLLPRLARNRVMKKYVRTLMHEFDRLFSQ